MAKEKAKGPIDLAATELRKLALSQDEGAFLGSEDDLVTRLRVARVTVRQAARMLEREGLMFVRRGIKGGYFAARPKVEMLETVFCAYLETLGLDTRHTGNVTTALWSEALREAASADRALAHALAERFLPQVESIGADANLHQIADLQHAIRTAIFELIGGSYIELLFRINTAFSRQQLASLTGHLDEETHRRFVGRWKDAVQLELRAIVAGDPMLAMTAALHERSVWLDRGAERDKRLAQTPAL